MLYTKLLEDAILLLPPLHLKELLNDKQTIKQKKDGNLLRNPTCHISSDQSCFPIHMCRLPISLHHPTKMKVFFLKFSLSDELLSQVPIWEFLCQSQVKIVPHYVKACRKTIPPQSHQQLPFRTQHPQIHPRYEVLEV